MKQEYIKGGWVKVLSNYGEAKVGDILQISSLPDQTLVNVKKDGHLVGSGLWTEHSGWDPQCEWYGMEAPTEKKEAPVEDVLKVGEWYMIHENQLPITSGWLGEGDKFKHQGPYKIIKMGSNCATIVSDGTKEISCTLGRSRWRKCHSHEIPQQKTETMETYKPQQGDWIIPVTPQDTPGCTLEKGKAYQLHRIGSYCSVNQHGGDIYPRDFRKARPEEIPGSAKTEEWVPKVGDWVEILQCASGQNWASDMNQYVGKIVKIGRKDGNDNYRLEGCGDWDWNYKSNPHFKKASAPREEAPKKDSMQEILEEANRRYKPGDKVKCASGGSTEKTITSLKIYSGKYITNEMSYYVYYNGRWAEKIEEKKEDLIAEAKRRFPMGTKFIPFDMRGREYTVNGNNYYDADRGQSIIVSTEQGHNQYVCYMGKWSTKVEEKTEDLLSKARRLYPKGTQYRGVRDGNIEKAIHEPEQGISGGNIWVGYDYIYMDGKWAEIVSSYEQEERSYERELGTKIVETMSTGVEKMPSEIIVKRENKVGKRRQLC